MNLGIRQTLLRTLVAGLSTVLALACGSSDYTLGPAPIVCFGDSLTAGTGAPPGRGYPEQLSAMIGRDVINAGVPGDTTEMALRRLDRDVLSLSPSAVLITLGGNDYLRKVPKDEAFSNLEQIISRLQREAVLVIVGGFDVPFFGKGFESEYKRVSRTTNCELIPNVYKGISRRRGHMADGIHPNENGYTIMAEHFASKLEPYLD